MVAFFTGFYKKVVILNIGTKFYSYKISKKGAQKIGELTPTGNQFFNVFGNKVVLQTQTPPNNYKFDEYSWDLKKKKKGIEGDGIGWPQVLDFKKGTAAFTTQNGMTSTVEIVTP